MSRLWKMLLRIATHLLVVLVLALPVVELFLRVEERIVWAVEKTDTSAGMRIYGHRLNRRLWKMFLENGSQDLRVLAGNESVANLLPPNGQWSAVDFLLPEGMREASRFSVTSDRHGFRGLDKKLTKKDYRIMVLGAYQAFGHGVEDGETYSALLEEKLKASKKLRKRGLRPLVFNGGMQSASLERGVKTLEEKFAEIRPRLVILDYGMTDQVSAGMNPWLRPFAAFTKPGTRLYEVIDRSPELNFPGMFGSSYLFHLLVNRTMEENLEPNRSRFRARLYSIIGELKRKGVLVLLLDQPVAGVPGEFYHQLVSKFGNADFLSVRAVLEAKGRRAANQGTAAWLEEFPGAFRAYYWKKNPGLAPFLGNMLHVNRAGHEAIAEALAAWVEENGVRP